MESNILFIVEGNNTEWNFFKRLSESFSLNYEIYCLGTNIYTLYKKMKEIEFNGNVKDILAEIHPEKKAILSKRFAFTYLIFDCDAHHPKIGDTRTIDEIISNNFLKLKEMAEYFIDETDPTIGKLYINYPMMESYRDCDDFFDNNYENAVVSISGMRNYKTAVSKRKLCRIHLDKYSKQNFESLILQNIYKLNKLANGTWEKPSYKKYVSSSEVGFVLDKEKGLTRKEKIISVLNTSLFMLVDFFGNKDGFYDSLEMTQKGIR